MRQGIFPQQLKRSFVVPIPKLSPPVSIEDDLRPISLTSQIAKVMEDFSLRSLMVEIRDKIDVKQFAVLGKSTTQALVYLLHIMLAALDAGHCFVRLFFVEKDLTWLIITYLLMNLKTLMSIQLSYGGLDPFL